MLTSCFTLKNRKHPNSCWEWGHFFNPIISSPSIQKKHLIPVFRIASHFFLKPDNVCIGRHKDQNRLSGASSGTLRWWDMGERNKNTEDTTGISGLGILTASLLFHLFSYPTHNPNYRESLCQVLVTQGITKGFPCSQGVHCLVKEIAQSCNYDTNWCANCRMKKAVLGLADTRCRHRCVCW
jgi:hypothetical protein